MTLCRKAVHQPMFRRLCIPRTKRPLDNRKVSRSWVLEPCTKGFPDSNLCVKNLNFLYVRHKKNLPSQTSAHEFPCPCYGPARNHTILHCHLCPAGYSLIRQWWIIICSWTQSISGLPEALSLCGVFDVSANSIALTPNQTTISWRVFLQSSLPLPTVCADHCAWTLCRWRFHFLFQMIPAILWYWDDVDEFVFPILHEDFSFLWLIGHAELN